MDSQRTWIRDAWIGLAYFALASVSIYTTRFDGGLAFLWLASAMLITVLGRRPRHRWRSAILWSAAGSFFATGLFGLGWALAPFLALANMAEAVLAAFLLRQARSALLPLGSPRWFANLAWATGLIGPLAMAAIAALPMLLATGQDPLQSAFRVVAGHGLSNLTFIPIFKLFATSRRGLWRRRAQRKPGRFVPVLFAVHLSVTAAVFSQASLPLLFLPVLPLVAIVFRGNSRWSAASLLALAAVASGATLAGFGPVHLADIGAGAKMQVLQFYLLSTVLTIVPIAAQMRRSHWLAGRVRDSEARYKMLADHSGDVIMHSDEDGIVRFVSPSIERVGGYRAADLIGRDSSHMIHSDFHAVVNAHYELALSGLTRDTRFEYRARRSDGRWCWFESECRGLTEPDGSRGVVSIIRDISDRKAREEQLATAAMTDVLTGLPNRRAFRDAAGAIASDPNARTAAIAILDIDHFKAINDSFGHDAGDEVLQGLAAVALRLSRKGDMMARLGGEEFAVLLPDTNVAEAIKVCDRLRTEIAQSVCMTAQGPVRITVSGGVAPLTLAGLDDALRRADEALYRAKRQGRDRLLQAVAA